jgi:hypothetical protein
VNLKQLGRDALEFPGRYVEIAFGKKKYYSSGCNVGTDNSDS